MENRIAFILLIVTGLFISCKKGKDGSIIVAPIAPTNLNAEVGSTPKVNLIWTDNSTNEDGFKIERKTSNGNYAIISTVSKNITSYLDTTVVNNETYTYRLYSFNSVGSSLSYSNEKTVSIAIEVIDLLKGLIAYYPFNGNAVDESGNGLNATVNAALLTTDKKGISNSAYFFNGTNSYISVPHNGLFDVQTTGKFSFSYWMNASSLNDTKLSVILSKQIGYASLQDGWNNGIETNFLAATRMQNGTSSSLVTISNLVPISVNSDYMITVTFDKSKDSICQYVNDQLISSKTIGSGLIGDNSSNFLIGMPSWDAGNVKNFHGKIDEVRIYNRALTYSEIKYLYSK